MSRNLQKDVTDRILSQLKAGTVPWRKPWSGDGFAGMPRNALTQRAYSGVNVLLLWSRAEASGYAQPLWMTFKQASDAGAHIRKGEKGEMVIFVSRFEREDDAGAKRFVPFLRAFTVFNVAQVEGLAFQDNNAPMLDISARIDEAESFIKATGATIHHGGGRAFFRPLTDDVTLPPFETFAAPSAYYATAFHEITHWTGAEKRLNRMFGKRFGDQAYSAEELVAELGSAFLCAEFGFDNDIIDNSAAYISSWIKFLTDHDNAIVTAASHASKAVDYMRGLALTEEQIAA